MTKTIVRLFVAACTIAVSSAAQAEVNMPVVFGSDMVIQRELPVPVWGTAAPGEKISVAFAGQEVVATADDQGRWMATLQPLATSKTNRTMVVTGSNTITFQRVLVGEVWLCSGQSNMAGCFRDKYDIEPEYLEMDLSRFRFCSRRGWKEVSNKTKASLSRVAFYFGVELVKELDIPIGLITRYNSGTPIQAWMPKDASEVIRKKLAIEENWRDPEKKEPRQPGAQFDEKIVPIVPVAFRGVIWYQGERNAKSQTAWEYDQLLAFHIKTWRELWAKQAEIDVRNFSFYYVQVPTQDIRTDYEFVWLRDRMRRALDITENTGMAVCYDYGPSLHPENKQPFGQRLSLWALAKDYGRKDLVHCGPLLETVTIDGRRVVLSFKHVGSGLKSKAPEKKLKFFELAGQDGEYVSADAWIEGDTVVVQSEKIAAPVSVRYLFRKPEPNPEVSLINAEGLPASSFMTDDARPKRTSGGMRPAEIRKAKRAADEAQQKKTRRTP